MLTPEQELRFQELDAKFNTQNVKPSTNEFPVQNINAPRSQGLTPEQEARFQELDAKFNQPQVEEKINPYQEAELGIFNRGRYAIEPIQSNRIALLQQEFGPENVKLDQKNEPYIFQDNQWVPVNQAGISTADIADIAGTSPEIIGGGIGLPAGPLGAAAGGAAP